MIINNYFRESALENAPFTVERPIWDHFNLKMTSFRPLFDAEFNDLTSKWPKKT